MVRECFVPTCKNNTKNSPNKLFVRIREDMRERWCREVNAEYFKIYTMYCCEDHFDPQMDLKNYFKCKLMNDVPMFKPTAMLRYISHSLPQDKEPANEEYTEPEVKVEPPEESAKEPTIDEYMEPEVKVEPPEESAFTIVIRDPLADTTLEGSFRELFHSRENPVVDPGVDHGVDSEVDPGVVSEGDPGDDSEGDPGDGALVIDEPEPPAKKSRQTNKPTLDINYYKAELARYKKEVQEQMAEIQKQQNEIKSKDETIKRLNASVKNLLDKNTALKKETSELRQGLVTATCKITELKRQKKPAKSKNSHEVPYKKEPTTKIVQENFKALVDNQLSDLATQIDEQNLALQIINFINDNLIKLAARINKELTMTSKEFAKQLLSSVNMQLTELEIRIRKQKMALATHKEKKEVTIQSILLDSLNEQGQL